MLSSTGHPSSRDSSVFTAYFFLSSPATRRHHAGPIPTDDNGGGGDVAQEALYLAVPALLLSLSVPIAAPGAVAMARHFEPALAPASKPHQFTSGLNPTLLLTASIKLPTLVVGGALAQAILCALLPLKWAIALPVVLMVRAAATTAVQLLSRGHHAYSRHVIPGRQTSQLPSRAGEFGPAPAGQPLVVFNLGIQFNHPLGIAAPRVREVAGQFTAMMEELHRQRAEYGLLNMSPWTGTDRASNKTILLSFYFRDVESVHQFAHADTHREAWRRFHQGGTGHIGIFHETFVVEERGYESMYVNCHPVQLGRGEVRCDTVREGEGGGDGDDDGHQWLNTLVSADTPVLNTQMSRLGRDEDGTPKQPWRR